MCFRSFLKKNLFSTPVRREISKKIKSFEIEKGQRIRNLRIEISRKMFFPLVFDSRKFSLHFPKPVPFFQLFSILHESASCDVSRQSKFYADSESVNGIVLTWVERREKNIPEMQKKNFFSKKIFFLNFLNFFSLI